MSTAPQRYSFIVDKSDSSQDLLGLLQKRIGRFGKAELQVLIEMGSVYLERDGEKSRLREFSRRLRKADKIEVIAGTLFQRECQLRLLGRSLKTTDVPALKIIHEDDALCIIEKPSGVPSCATPESDWGSAEYILQQRLTKQRQQLDSGSENVTAEPLFVVHRLDQGTSGLMLFARTRLAAAMLSRSLKKHQIERRYLLLWEGELSGETQLTADSPIDDKIAKTHFQFIRNFEGYSEWKASLETGRMHQIRKHAQGLGHPLLADPKYGNSRSMNCPRLALHSTSLKFCHPLTHQELNFESAWPQDIANFIESQE